MKTKLDPRLKLARVKLPIYAWQGDDQNGAFYLRGPGGRMLFMLASRGDGWEHVSVSAPDSGDTPTWAEMCFVKNLWFEPEETVVQYHPPESQYVNFVAGCLHMWRPLEQSMPMPPLSHV